MKPKYISFDAAFERKFKKYKARLSEAELEKPFYRMFLFAVVGFVVFFTAALIYFGIRPVNPYSGPPLLMTDLILGIVGMVLGVLASLVKKRA